MARERVSTSQLARTAERPRAADGGAGRPRPGSHRRSRTPRGHWVLVGLVMLVFAVGLVVEGYTRGVLGENNADEPRPGPHAVAAPATVTGGGPVVAMAGSHVHSFSMPARTVALTFDDGPDPAWTPKILAVLRQYRVPATFFLVGVHVASCPGLAREELSDGFELGSHTYTHANLAAAVGWREGFELTLTQNALAGAAGIRTRMLRMPYSSEPDALTAADWRAARQAAGEGYLVVLANLDTRDWATPGVARIEDAAMPSGGRGAIIMFHDGGGSRAQTVAALPVIITRLRAEGYRFATVTGALGLPSGDVPATGRQQLAGTALVVIQQAADHAVAVLAILLVAASVLTVIRLSLLVGFASAHRRRARRRGRSFRRDELGYVPDVSVVIPAYNEAAGIAATVRSMAASRYRGRIEIVVVDDGSTDGTAPTACSLGIPQVRVLRQPNTGKPGALNRGIAEARSEILVLVDGDTIFQADTLGRLIAPLAAGDVGAVSGNTKVGNRRGLLGGWQHLEYVMGFNLDRRLFDLLGTIPTVPGAIGAFRRAALTAAGGVSADTLAEDTDLTMALCRSPWRVVYAPDAIAWTEAPSSLRQLWRQRHRWSYGTLQAMWKHRRAVIEHGQPGRFGRYCLTYLALFHVLLPLIAPVVDVFSVYGLIFLNPVKVIGFWTGFVLLQAIAGGYALRLDGERLRSLWLLPLQQVVYRQLMYLVTIQSVITALLGTRQRWQVIRRAGVFADQPDVSTRSPALPVPGRRCLVTAAARCAWLCIARGPWEERRVFAYQIVSFTGPEEVVWTQVAEPAADGGVVIDVAAAGVSFADLLQTTGAYQMKVPVPYTPGMDAAGIVRSAPPGSGFAAGQRVAVLLPYGCWQEVIAAPAARVLPLPVGMSLQAGAAAPLNYLTVLFALVQRARAERGETLLVHGAAGGVGTAAIAVGRALGLRTVAVVSDEAKKHFAVQHGADHAVLADGWLAAVRDLLGERPADIVVDPVGGDRITDSLRSLAPEGRLVVVGFTGGEIPAVKVNRLLLGNTGVLGAASREFFEQQPATVGRLWARLLSLRQARALPDPPVQAFPFADARGALRAIAHRQATGKVVLTRQR